MRDEVWLMDVRRISGRFKGRGHQTFLKMKHVSCVYKY